MKGLILSAQGHNTEALAVVKKVLFKNLSNFTCWHVYGIINRKEKDYDQARRCYINAIKYNTGSNDVILRDLSYLQAHLREYEGFKESRRQLLLKNPGDFEHWVSYACGCYMAGDFENCIQSCESVLRFDTGMKKPMRPAQKMEVILLRVKALEKSLKFKEAIAMMVENKQIIVDKVQYFDIMARLRLLNGQAKKSVDNLESLLEINSVNFSTYYKIFEAKGIKLFNEHGNKNTLSSEEKATVKETMEYYAKGFPRVTAHERIAMKFLDGEDFAAILRRYVRGLLVKGAPAIMQDLREFYEDAAKVAAIESLLLGWLANMDKQMTLEENDLEEQDPTVLLWLLYFISNHYLWKRDSKQALHYINKAIAHTPTLLDLYTLKGKIYQKSGDPKMAAKLFEEAR
jgi:tetratricopeptide (TPR) repeat protein